MAYKLEYLPSASINILDYLCIGSDLMKHKMLLCDILIVISILGLCSCKSAMPLNNESKSLSSDFLLKPFLRLSDDIVNDLSIDEIGQKIFKIDNHCYGSTFVYKDFCYYIGESLSPDMVIAVTPLQYAGRSVYSWIETQGAASAVCHYLSFRDGEPVYLTGIEGQVTYVDLDNDGKNELIASTVGSLPTQVTIYFWDESEYGKTESLDVAEALNAYSATYQEGYFIVTKGEGMPEEKYTYTDGKFDRIELSQ